MDMIISTLKINGEALNQLIEAQTGKDLVQAMGYKFANAVEGDEPNTVVIKYYGEAPAKEKKAEYLGEALWTMTDTEIKSMNYIEDRCIAE